MAYYELQIGWLLKSNGTFFTIFCKTKVIDKKWVVTFLVFITKTRWLSSDAYKCFEKKTIIFVKQTVVGIFEC